MLKETEPTIDIDLTQFSLKVKEAKKLVRDTVLSLNKTSK